VEFGRSRRTYDKAQIVASLPKERTNDQADGFIADSFRVRLLGEGLALVNYRSIRRDPDGSSRNSEAYEARFGSWWTTAGE